MSKHTPFPLAEQVRNLALKTDDDARRQELLEIAARFDTASALYGAAPPKITLDEFLEAWAAARNALQPPAAN